MLVNCAYCEVEFEKPDKEVRRSAENGRKHFCSLAHSAAYGNRLYSRGDVSRLNPSNRRDEYSPFRAHFALAQRHAKESGKKFALTLESIKAQWDSQNGTCPYTGWKMENPATTKAFNTAKKTPRRASLDRIDSSLGYEIGNVQFVAMMANFAKNTFTRCQLVEFCRAVAENHVL